MCKAKCCSKYKCKRPRGTYSYTAGSTGGLLRAQGLTSHSLPHLGASPVVPLAFGASVATAAL